MCVIQAQLTTGPSPSGFVLPALGSFCTLVPHQQGALTACHSPAHKQQGRINVMNNTEQKNKANKNVMFEAEMLGSYVGNMKL